MAPPMTDNRIDWVNKSFDKLDADHDGVVTIADVELVHNAKTSQTVALGKTSAAAIFQNLCRSIDEDGDGTITREEFVNYYREISPSVDTDEYWELMIKQAWRL
jgi:Ca2+-binding EF-hand superfamily protein